ncbi:hypothetical protein BaRGS_00040290, partial [Batillaria attramentaria]
MGISGIPPQNHRQVTELERDRMTVTLTLISKGGVTYPHFRFHGFDSEKSQEEQEPETVPPEPEHSQTPVMHRLTLTKRDKTKDATESSPDFNTQTASNVGLDAETDIKQERSWTEIRSVQADHGALCTPGVHSDTGRESCTVRHDTESQESADMSQHTTRNGVHNVGTEQFLCIKQEIEDTDFHQTAERELPLAIMNQKQTSGQFSPCPSSSFQAVAQTNETHTDSVSNTSIKTECHESTEASVSDTDMEDEPTHVYPAGLYQNVHAKSETSVNEQLDGGTTSILTIASAAGRLDTSECETHQQHTATSETCAQTGVKR